MNEIYLIGSLVKLISFNGKKIPPTRISPEENFWKLIGTSGQIIDNVPKKGILKNRILVKFELSLDEFDLPNHNEVPNTLWIARKDLALL